MPSGYQFAPVFLIRLAGVPFDILDGLATIETSRSARELIVRQNTFAKAGTELAGLLRSGGHGLSPELLRVWRKAIRSGATPASPVAQGGLFAAYKEAASDLAAADSRLTESLHAELDRARDAAYKAAHTVLPRYFVFLDAALRERLIKQSSVEVLPPRNKDARAHERHLLLYLQRVCAKNDSLSEFGPQGWGTVQDEVSGLKLAPQPGIARRESFLERWTAHATASVLNGFPEIRAELSPRLNPNGRIGKSHFVFTDTGETIPLDSSTLQLLARCDGTTPAHALGVELEVLEQLAERNMIRWEIDVPALEPHPFDVLLSDIMDWRAEARTRSLDLLQPIAALPGQFAEADTASARSKIMDEAGERLEQLGAVRKASGRFLYSATNPIGEECLRECGCSIGGNLINEVTTEAAPWIDLWRDCYAFVAGRVAAGLRPLLEETPLPNGAMPLPAFLRHCAIRQVPLTGPGLVGFAHLAFQEVKNAFVEKFAERDAPAEIDLTADDCRFVRQDFAYEKFDEYTYPSADIQLAAKSVEAVACGEYQWVLAELHPPAALLHHGFYWSCPDKNALSNALIKTVFGRPSFHFGFSSADFTSTTTVRLFDALHGLFNFVAPQRGHPSWPTVQPGEADVYIDQTSGDVCLRKHGTNEFLGSFARAWLIPLGFHPFAFSLGAHTPRLRCGKVIVQRRTWTVDLEELGKADFTGISRNLVLAVERLRARRDWPRYVYIRPTERALRRSGAEGRDKDTKPVFIDLESYLFLEIFYRWLTKAGEIEVTEMLPDPDHLLWREPDGRRTFELRTQIVPHS